MTYEQCQKNISDYQNLIKKKLKGDRGELLLMDLFVAPSDEKIYDATSLYRAIIPPKTNETVLKELNLIEKDLEVYGIAENSERRVTLSLHQILGHIVQ